jgi:hypothetical protein
VTAARVVSAAPAATVVMVAPRVPAVPGPMAVLRVQSGLSALPLTAAPVVSAVPAVPGWTPQV